MPMRSEDEEPGDGDDDEPINPLVDALFDEIEALRTQVCPGRAILCRFLTPRYLRQLFESEMRCAIVEAETREEVMQEMEERMRNMEKIYTRRLAREVSALEVPVVSLILTDMAAQIEENEKKTDAKIGLIQRAHRDSMHRGSDPVAISDDEDDLEDIAEENEIESGLEDDYRPHIGDATSDFAPSSPKSPLTTRNS